MKYLLILLTALLSLTSSYVYAQGDTTTSKKSAVSDAEFYVYNDGLFGLNKAAGAAGFFVPRGSNRNYIFQSGLWFGAKKKDHDTLLKLTFMTCDPQQGKSEAMAGEGWDGNGVRPDLYHSVDYDRASGKKIGAVGPSWPLWLLPAESASPMLPGRFVAFETDRNIGPPWNARPAFVPAVDEEFVARFHDTAVATHYSHKSSLTYGFPIGLQFQQTTLGWRSGRFKDCVLLEYEIVNKSGDTLRDCVAGQMADIEINGANDHFAYYSRRPEYRIGYGWPDFGRSATILMILLEAPTTDANGFIDNMRRREYRDSGRVGTCPTWTIQGDPTDPRIRYDFMTSGVKATSDTGGDRRGMVTSGLFSMLPGDTAHYAMVFAVVSVIPSAPAFSAVIDSLVPSITDQYYNGFIAGAPDDDAGNATAIAELRISPTPICGQATARFSVTRRSSVSISLVNLRGERFSLYDGRQMEAGTYSIPLDVVQFDPGVYIIEIACGQKRVAQKVAIVK